MLWDLFCRVIDNFGDIGVCWRLASDLAQRGQTVRLWVDDPSALAWMAPQVTWRTDPASGAQCGTGQHGVTVRRWQDAERPIAPSAPDVSAEPEVGDVVVEAFGCDPPDAFIARMHRRMTQGHAPQWINLEYLSAEDYVERSHGLRSPVLSGPGLGLEKRFFYPGFTPATGGLLREPALLAHRQATTGSASSRATVLRRHGVQVPTESPCILLFCYESAPVGSLLTLLARQPTDTHVLITPGPATRLAQRWQRTHAGQADTARVHLHWLPHLPQDAFDELLWCTDLNFVRGEDSAVRALWAGRPHVWQIYEQDDGVHAGKLDAFMDRWMQDWPSLLQSEIRALWRAWNHLAPWDEAKAEALLQAGPARSAWADCSRLARDRLCTQADLVSQLITFVTRSG